MPYKIVTIIGARPQFIKSTTVSLELQKYPDVEEVVIHTGQHFDDNMSDIFFRQLRIPKPTFELNLNGGSHGEMTGRMLIEIEKSIKKIKPSRVLVYGDTNSTLAGALSAIKLDPNILPLALISPLAVMFVDDICSIKPCFQFLSTLPMLYKLSASGIKLEFISAPKDTLSVS